YRASSVPSWKINFFSQNSIGFDRLPPFIKPVVTPPIGKRKRSSGTCSAVPEKVFHSRHRSASPQSRCSLSQREPKSKTQEPRAYHIKARRSSVGSAYI